MPASLRFVLLASAVVVLTSACSPSPPAPAVPIPSSGLLVRLPQSASPQQVISNLFRDARFVDGSPLAARAFRMVDTKGTVFAQGGLDGRKVGSYTIHDVFLVIYDHGSELFAEVDTDLGKKGVYMLYDAGCWNCRVEVIERATLPQASPTNTP